MLLIAVVLTNGLGVFWPAAVAQVELADGRIVLGQWVREETNPDTRERSVQLKNMPLANMTQMTDEERAKIGAWFAAGAK